MPLLRVQPKTQVWDLAVHESWPKLSGVMAARLSFEDKFPPPCTHQAVVLEHTRNLATEIRPFLPVRSDREQRVACCSHIKIVHLVSTVIRLRFPAEATQFRWQV